MFRIRIRIDFGLKKKAKKKKFLAVFMAKIIIWISEFYCGHEDLDLDADSDPDFCV